MTAGPPSRRPRLAPWPPEALRRGSPTASEATEIRAGGSLRARPGREGRRVLAVLAVIVVLRTLYFAVTGDQAKGTREPMAARRIGMRPRVDRRARWYAGGSTAAALSVALDAGGQQPGYGRELAQRLVPAAAAPTTCSSSTTAQQTWLRDA